MSDNVAHPAAGFGPGSRIGGYLLQEQVGHGGMAAVYRAVDERLGRPVALKVLAHALAADEAFRLRFIRESRTAAAVDDPHIIPVFEAGEADGVLFIAMRYVQGGDVRGLLFRAGALEPARVASLVSPIASALDAAHEAGLVHRDVKPANMLLDVRHGRPEHVYLSDFGLSKEALGSAGLTGTGNFVGTAGYSSPEQITGRQVDGRADQYALGCAAFEMLCGQPPFVRDQAMAVLLAHLHERPPAPTSLRPELPTAIDAVFARVLAKNPQHRFGSCGQFGDALRGALGLAPYEDGASARRAPTEIAQPALGPADAAQRRAVPVTQTLRQTGAGDLNDWSGNGSARRPGRRRPLAIASAAAALAVVITVIVLVTRLQNPPASTGPGSTGKSSATDPCSHTGGRAPATNLNNVWIAQLAAVPCGDIKDLRNTLVQIRTQEEPGARWVNRDDYISLRPGFWMIFYYSPSFTDGTQVIAYCDRKGLTANPHKPHCFGRILSHDSSYSYDPHRVLCYPAQPATSTCRRRLGA